ncbi:hypothetical protein BJF79_31835 [Actinomadura sp. CNU-125]|uniref:DUF5691 domain-containing protein n=1 Tax=Actinomadura sp. CNU-125 TaxID=1904961 RepID=UPI00095C4981|nr:hypothetical protein [Actinomadura sp. CNU-125]OLT35755.1 hypothetical protein BJF79_31835 [Actinomadura sp. CNU-125]
MNTPTTGTNVSGPAASDGGPDGPRAAWIWVGAPEEHDAGLARDGVPFHPGGSFAPRPGSGPVGTRGAWLREILARTPLTAWTSLFGLPPAAIVRLPVPGAPATCTSGGHARR